MIILATQDRAGCDGAGTFKPILISKGPYGDSGSEALSSNQLACSQTVSGFRV